MLATFAYIVLIALLIHVPCGNCQSVLNVPNASDGIGNVGFPFIYSLLSAAFLITLLASLVDNTENLNDACDALFEDSDVAEAKEEALDDCKECTGLNQEDCEDNANCAFSDGTCFIRGDQCVPALFCSFAHRDPQLIANCQICFGLPQDACIEDEPNNVDCNFVADSGLCVPDTDDFD